jgi:hypothetical protein
MHSKKAESIICSLRIILSRKKNKGTGRAAHGRRRIARSPAPAAAAGTIPIPADACFLVVGTAVAGTGVDAVSAGGTVAGSVRVTVVGGRVVSVIAVVVVTNATLFSGRLRRTGTSSPVAGFSARILKVLSAVADEVENRTVPTPSESVVTFA